MALAATTSIDEHSWEHDADVLSWELDADDLEYLVSRGYVARKDVEGHLAGEEDTHRGIVKRAGGKGIKILLKCKPKIPKCIIKSPKIKTFYAGYRLARLGLVAACTAIIGGSTGGAGTGGGAGACATANHIIPGK